MRTRRGLAMVCLCGAVGLSGFRSVSGASEAAGDCPNGTGSLNSDVLISSLCLPQGLVGLGSTGNSGGSGGANTVTGLLGGGGASGGGNHFKWIRDWLDGDFGTMPRDDCHELPQNNCQDFEHGGVSSPLTCTLASGQPGRPFRDTLIDTLTGEVVSQTRGCFDPATGTTTPDGGTTTGPNNPPPPPTAAEVVSAANLPRMQFGLSPSGMDCVIQGTAPASSSGTRVCLAGDAPGLTGLDTLLWVNPPPPREVSVTVDIRGYSVTSRAHPVRFMWDMRQNGDAASTRNPAASFATDTAGTADAPAARYRWETKGDYHLSLAVVWEGSYTYTGFGTSRTEPLGPVRGQPTVMPYHVVEVRSVATAER